MAEAKRPMSEKKRRRKRMMTGVEGMSSVKTEPREFPLPAAAQQAAFPGSAPAIGPVPLIEFSIPSFDGTDIATEAASQSPDAKPKLEVKVEIETSPCHGESMKPASSDSESDGPDLEFSVPSPTVMESAGDEDDMTYVVRKILWRITSACYCQGVLGEEDVADHPSVKLEAEPTNPVDPNAIKLLFQARNGEWVHGGYVPRTETQRVRDLRDKILGIEVHHWISRGFQRIPYVQLRYTDRVKRVRASAQTLLTPSIVTEDNWVGIYSRKYASRKIYGKWLVFVEMERLDSIWHQVAYRVENGLLGRGCTAAKCSTSKYNPNCTDSREGVIVVYTTRSAVNPVGFKLSKLTRIPTIHYKTEAATKAGVYAGDPGCIIKTIHYNSGIPKLTKKKSTWQ